MIIWSDTLAKIARPIVDAYENQYRSIEWIEESLDDFYKALNDFAVLCNLDIFEEESEMDKDQYKCIAVYSDSCMIIYGIEEVEELLNDGWLIDETIDHDDFVMYIMHHFPVDSEE